MGFHAAIYNNSDCENARTKSGEEPTSPENSGEALTDAH
jgi:hypothetical protein